MSRKIFYSIFFTSVAVMVLTTIFSAIFINAGLIPNIMIAGILLVFSSFFSRWITELIVSPIKNINVREPLASQVYPELLPAMEYLDMQQKQLRTKEQELRYKADQFSALVEHMPEGIILLNADGIIMNLNSSAADILDTGKDCVGDHILSVRNTRRMHNIIASLEKGDSAQVVLEKNNVCYQINASPITAENGIIGFVLAMFDVTNREEAKRIRRDFTANVSHELKTPLHTISGCAELLSYNMVKPEDVQEFAATIYKESLRMIHLVEDIIELSHLEVQKIGEDKIQTNVLQVAQEAVNALYIEAEEANVEISCSGDDVSLMAVPRLLLGIIYDLCDNAIKYNKPGGSVEVLVQNKDKEVVLTVKDTGIGIAPEHQERVFERFYRVDKSHSRNIGGTGLGLSIVKHAADIHSAIIELESQLDEGTTITVCFPKEPDKYDKIRPRMIFS